MTGLRKGKTKGNDHQRGILKLPVPKGQAPILGSRSGGKRGIEGRGRRVHDAEGDRLN